MSQLFARIELKGTPTDDVYQRLHKFMLDQRWYQLINSTAMPHAMYQATLTNNTPDLPAIARGLKQQIEKAIWTRSLVLLIRSADWAQSAG
jgi:hypothetical protein